MVGLQLASCLSSLDRKSGFCRSGSGHGHGDCPAAAGLVGGEDAESNGGGVTARNQTASGGGEMTTAAPARRSASVGHLGEREHGREIRKEWRLTDGAGAHQLFYWAGLWGRGIKFYLISWITL